MDSGVGGHRVLVLGAGVGTVSAGIRRQCPTSTIVGVDVDGVVLQAAPLMQTAVGVDVVPTAVCADAGMQATSGCVSVS